MEDNKSLFTAIIRSKIFWLLAAGGAAVLAIFYQESPERFPPVKNMVVPKGTPVESGVKIPAPAKKGEPERLFTAPELRWVLAQEKLLKTMRPLLKSNYAVTRFNQLVKDFNARTGRYSYVDRDMKEIEKETNARSAEIEAEARKTVERWNKL